ncbi:hypothetical protein SCLCIDRAFT_806713 [Scleroderma citrinum Foug A]|uniref:Uncharacterized protein n=1 Tax=Scleroderma citrinum Foug A TaxID=1036808 RepID=A0A0C3E3D7_9AGAM|nr:hypothetical protein SCLCIDRAFT_806713 [Scleroderma citrinum Foug A]
MECPCRLSNLLAPGVPDFLCQSSSATGKESKFIPRSRQSLQSLDVDVSRETTKRVHVIFIDYQNSFAAIKDLGEVVHTFTLTSSIVGIWRASMNWTVQMIVA